MATVGISATIPPELRDRLDEIATTACVTRSWIITRVMTGWVDSLAAAERAGGSRDLVLAAAIADTLEPAA